MKQVDIEKGLGRRAGKDDKRKTKKNMHHEEFPENEGKEAEFGKDRKPVSATGLYS